MVYDFYPTLKPLFSDLDETLLRNYLVTTEFNRFLIKNEYENLWEDMHKKRKKLTYVGV
jgi:hypothetical protein